MELPSSRELELEILLRERDAQLADISDEVTRLRQYLSTQPGPSTSDPVSLPPAFVSVLLPRLAGATSSAASTASTSNTVTAALTQRAKLLQEENDELYELLKRGETGKLKEEVRSLRRVVEKLEGALRESHQVINNLSMELDKSYEALASSSRSTNNFKSQSHSPHSSYHPLPSSNLPGNGYSTSKLPPTGPRAHKKPRLSEATASPPPRSNGPSSSHKSKNHNHFNSNSFREPREFAPRHIPDRKSNHAKMEIDDDQARPPSPAVDHDRDRERNGIDRERERNGTDRERERNGANRERERNGDRDRERNGGDRERGTKDRERGVRERDRDRDRERDRDGNRSSHPRRNGNGNFLGNSNRGGGVAANTGGPGRRTDRDRGANMTNNVFNGGDRTLAERLGL